MSPPKLKYNSNAISEKTLAETRVFKFDKSRILSAQILGSCVLNMWLENISRCKEEAFFRYPFVVVGGDRMRKIDMIHILFIQKTNAF